MKKRGEVIRNPKSQIAWKIPRPWGLELRLRRSAEVLTRDSSYRTLTYRTFRRENPLLWLPKCQMVTFLLYIIITQVPGVYFTLRIYIVHTCIIRKQRIQKLKTHKSHLKSHYSYLVWYPKVHPDAASSVSVLWRARLRIASSDAKSRESLRLSAWAAFDAPAKTENNIQSVNNFEYQGHTLTAMRFCTFPSSVGPSAQIRDLTVSRNGILSLHIQPFRPPSNQLWRLILANGSIVSNPVTAVGNFV